MSSQFFSSVVPVGGTQFYSIFKFFLKFGPSSQQFVGFEVAMGMNFTMSANAGRFNPRGSGRVAVKFPLSGVVVCFGPVDVRYSRRLSRMVSPQWGHGQSGLRALTISCEIITLI